MVKKRKNNFLKNLFRFVSCFVLVACVDPARPEYQFIDGLVYVEAFASTQENGSFVTIYESNTSYVNFRNDVVDDAAVFFVNENTGSQVSLNFESDRYYPPLGFKVQPNEIWSLKVTFNDGTTYLSRPEEVKEPIAILDISSEYKENLTYQNESERFVPGHEIKIDFNDPAGEANYYLWDFKSYEKASFCGYCENGVYRNGECVPIEAFPNRQNFYYDYYCPDSNCWQIRYNDGFKLFSDEFTDGLLQNDLSVAEVILFTKNNLLLELEQYALSAEAYEYYRVINDIIENNESLNAPPPAAFIGNLFNPNDPNEIVLGRFTAASATSKRLFIRREGLNGRPTENGHPLEVEVCREVCDAQDCIEGGPCQPVLSVPCEEGRFRTGNRPEGWQD